MCHVLVIFGATSEGKTKKMDLNLSKCGLGKGAAASLEAVEGVVLR